MEPQVELSGVVERVIFKSAENGFAVFALKVSAHDVITVNGTIGELHQGTQVTIKGTWSNHPKFGRQFQAQECSVELPSSAMGIQKYLSSGLIKGIGPKFAEKLVQAFGANTLEVIDKEPDRLFSVAGVGQKRVEAISRAWQDQKRDLKGHGFFA